MRGKFLTSQIQELLIILISPKCADPPCGGLLLALKPPTKAGRDPSFLHMEAFSSATWG